MTDITVTAENVIKSAVPLIINIEDKVVNNNNVKLLFEQLRFKPSLGQNYLPGVTIQDGSVSYAKITKVSVDWGDNSNVDEYILPIDPLYNGLNDILSDWPTIAGPHYYSLSKPGDIQITIKFTDSSDNVYTIILNVTVVARSFYDLKIELDAKKIIYNGEKAGVVFKINNIDSTDEKVFAKSDIPLFSILE